MSSIVICALCDKIAVSTFNLTDDVRILTCARCESELQNGDREHGTAVGGNGTLPIPTQCEHGTAGTTENDDAANAYVAAIRERLLREASERLRREGGYGFDASSEPDRSDCEEESAGYDLECWTLVSTFVVGFLISLVLMTLGIAYVIRMAV